MENKTAFIGHRNIYCPNLKTKLLNAVEQEIKNGCILFTMGTHGDFDNLALTTCRKLRKTYPSIDIEVVITSLNTIKPEHDFDPVYGDEVTIPYSDVKTIMYDIEETFYKRKIIESNKQMINSCSTLICYVNPKNLKSGACRVLNYAKKKGLRIVNLFEEL